MEGIIAIIMTFSIPIIAILTTYFYSQSKLKLKILDKEFELEKLKHENYLLETKKMTLELEQIKLENDKEKTTFI